MPLHPPHALQARRSSSIALVGDGAPLRGGSDFSPARARRMLTPHRAMSSCVGLAVARIDARASLTTGASARSAGKSMMVAGAVGMSATRRLACAIPGRIAVKDCPDWVCGTALAAAANINPTSNTNLCMITPSGCDHATRSLAGQGFLCGNLNCRDCSSATATARTQPSGLGLPAHRSRRASAARSKQAASRSRSPWSRQRNSVRASKPNAYRNIAVSGSIGGELVSVMARDYRAETGVFHASQAENGQALNLGTGISGKPYPKRGA